MRPEAVAEAKPQIEPNRGLISLSIKKLWLVYAIINIVVCVYGAIDAHLHGGQIGVLDILEYISELFMCVGVTMYALQTRVFSAAIWKYILWIIIAYSAILIAYNIVKHGPSFLIAFSIFIIPVIPAYIAMYRYAYMSPKVWNRLDT